MFRLEMDFCVEAGIPHGEFLEWSEEDQAKAIAYVTHKRSLCQKCGTNPDDWVDKEGHALEPPPYMATTVRCYGCVTLEDANGLIPKDLKGSITAHLTRTRPQWQMKKSP